MASQMLGAVVSYIGTLGREELLRGEDGSIWMLCDGAAISRTTYRELYDTVGDTFGSCDDQKNFKLPDLRGRFVRVLDLDAKGGTKGRDPGLFTQRKPMVQVTPPIWMGSLQSHSAGPHAHSLSNYAEGRYDFSVFRHRDYLSDNAAAEPFAWTEFAGGDETRPRNVALNFIMRVAATPLARPTKSALPVGAIVYCSQLTPVGAPNEQWLACTSDALLGRSDNQPLFDVVGTSFGAGDGTTTFGMLDLRGYFIRGVDASPGRGPSKNDPDAVSRKPTNPNLEPIAVGSTQAAAVTDHSHTIMNTRGVALGEGTRIKLAASAGHPRSRTKQTKSTQSVGLLEGSDIRPVNTALAAAILAANPSGTLPVGAVVAYAGSTDPCKEDDTGDVWLICDGRELKRWFPGYAKLFNALCTPGSDPAPPLQLPDLRGRFVRGLEPDGHLDKHVTERTPMFAGAKGGAIPTSLQADELGRHQHCINSHQSEDYQGGGTQAISGGGGDSGQTDGVIEGGGGDTRPINMYLHYIIRIQ